MALHLERWHGNRRGDGAHSSGFGLPLSRPLGPQPIGALCQWLTRSGYANNTASSTSNPMLDDITILKGVRSISSPMAPSTIPTNSSSDRLRHRLRALALQYAWRRDERRLVMAMHNPYVTIVGHLDRPSAAGTRGLRPAMSIPLLRSYFVGADHRIECESTPPRPRLASSACGGTRKDSSPASIRMPITPMDSAMRPMGWLSPARVD